MSRHPSRRTGGSWRIQHLVGTRGQGGLRVIRHIALIEGVSVRGDKRREGEADTMSEKEVGEENA